MTQVGGAFVRIRPTLDADEREALEEISANARSLADGLDSYLSKFAICPALEEETPPHD